MSEFLRAGIGVRNWNRVLWLAAICVVGLAGSAVGAESSPAPAALSGIEGLYSQQFSEKIFYFLIFSIVLFTIIVFAFLFGGKSKKLKTGEKWLFGLIFFGIVVAIIFGATQMLDGMLF